MSIRNTAIVALASLAVGFAVAIVAVMAWPGGGTKSTTVAQLATPTASATTAQSSGQPVSDSSCVSAADIYQQLRPSVVKVITTTAGNGNFGQQGQGEGSGIVIDKQGHVLTNFHVAGDATSLEVKFADSTTAPAHLVGSDPGNDLAVIQVDGASAELTPAALADSSAVRVGDSVLAIGNPFELEGTLTAGIVSATDRTYNPGNNARPILGMIQTDAPVNPGNSGGPLLNCQGKVIGVVTALENPTGQDVNVGIAFAVPSNTATASLPSMISGQTVSHPRLGIAGQDLTPQLSSQLKLSVTSGVYVVVVEAGSPADQAGLKGAFATANEANQSSTVAAGGDVITKIDGQSVSSVPQLASYVSSKKVGDTVELTIVRDGATKTMQAKLAEWPSN